MKRATLSKGATKRSSQQARTKKKNSNVHKSKLGRNPFLDHEALSSKKNFNSLPDSDNSSYFDNRTQKESNCILKEIVEFTFKKIQERFS